MALTKILPADLTGKGVVGLPDTPGLSTTEMQEKFDEIANDVIVPKHNSLVDDLEATTGASNLGALSSTGTASNIQTELDNRYPISTVTQLLNNKVDKEEGKTLSTNDFSAAYKYKLDNIEDNANNYVLPKGSQTSLGGVMGDGTTFTIDENGYGHAIGGGGGGTADYNALVNKPVVNGVTVSGNKASEEYGLLRPYLVVTSEAGSTITISKGGETITATQKSGSTTQWEVNPTSYGTWTVSSDLPGADIATTTIVIDAVKTYSITVEHITATITVTYQAGATCVCKKGTTEYVATSNPQTFTVRSIGTWTIETVYDGIPKSVTVPITADEQTESVSIGYATIEVTYGNAFRGTTITCASGATVYSKTAPSGGNTLSFTIASTGTWRVSGTVGSDTYNQDVVVSAMTSYSAILQVFNATVTVTFPYSEGASCTITDGVTTLTANTSPMAFNVPNVGTWTATCTIDGVSAPTQSAVITTDGQTETMTFAFGTINLTYDNAFRGLTITCVNGGTTISKTAPISGNTMAFYPPSTGEWIISATYSGVPYQTSATITSLATPVSASLQQLPNGKTVTPTDDIQKWLNCAGIFDKVTYTTLADVLADSTTLLALMSDNNASDYLVRSKTWCGNGQSLVPVMTSATTPSGVVSVSAEASANNYYGWKAFNPTEERGWFASATGFSTDDYIEYEFPSSCVLAKATVSAKATSSGSNDFYFKIQTYNGSSWVDVSSEQHLSMGNTSGQVYSIDVNLTNIELSSKVKLVMTRNSTNMNGLGIKIQFYAPTGITANSTAMTDIGANNYCANTLLDDATWCSAICNSTYFESVLNVKVPTMTSATTPSGECFADSLFTDQEPYKAFDNNSTTTWSSGALNYGTGYVGYSFTSQNKMYLADFTQRFLSGTYPPRTGVIKYQGTNNISGTWNDISDEITINAWVNSSPQVIRNRLYGTTKYQHYRCFYVSISGSTEVYPTTADLQFYGRQDI